MIPGLKVSARDVRDLLARPWPVPIRLLEVHLAPADLAHPRDVAAAFSGLAASHLLAVHQPFLLPDGRIPDLAAAEEKTRKDTRAMLEAAGEFSAAIDASFLIIHPGGARREGEVEADPEHLARSLELLEVEVPVLLENMPFWYDFPDGTRGRSTLGRTPEELQTVDDLVAGWCLDTSHAWGAREPGHPENLAGFLPHASRILHVHAAGSASPDREGLALARGEIDVAAFAALARALGPKVAAVPEIRGAHADPELTEEALAWLTAAGVWTEAAGPQGR